ncbi:hypothetical protein NEMBOFW57_008267 [Staphylotrichum longicolle]|uniref:Uncharacterized protein n=1 Tax=Staphylotrichum longicolle TaxID=669026 RepID=A0AAD4EQX3_9PEZI|nr:hypothetical protein NEMBOFW57_008267 [Staphylotrichum longicolle]
MALAFHCRHQASGGTKGATDELTKKSNEAEKIRLQATYLDSPNNCTDALTSAAAAIPDPAIFASLDHGADIPSVGECATHLELLEAFLMLQQKVLTSNALDRAFGIAPKPKVQMEGWGRSKKATIKPDETFQNRRAVKWDTFVRLAAARFQRWWHCVGEMLATAARGSPSEDMQIDARTMPPLGSWPKLKFPWAEIHSSLASTATPSPSALDLFNHYVGTYDLFTLLTAQTPSLKATLTLLTHPTRPAPEPLPRFEGLHTLPPSTTATATPSLTLTALTAAVARQTRFAHTMAGYLWLRSPAAHATLQRAVARHARFAALLGRDRGRALMPTADIELVRRTNALARRGVDSLCGGGGSDGEEEKGRFRETRVLYEGRWKEEYGGGV